MENDLFWDKEEFEDTVARGLIALYETKIKKKRGSNKAFLLTHEILNNVRNIGCYFAPDDRICLLNKVENSSTHSSTQYLDIVNEGRPDRAVWCNTFSAEENENDSMRKNSFLEISYLERISKLPHPIKTKYEGRAYRHVFVWARNDCLEGHVHHIVISSKGEINDTYWIRHNYNPITGICPMEIVDAKYCQSKEESMLSESQNTVHAHVTIQFWQDRRFLWNVVAKESVAKATFGVHEEQIKSLFYSREMPMTETGRKRPILHWVNSHQRRMKNGIDIDIEKHLRGINEFVYNGTKFIITKPIKRIVHI